MQEREVIFQGQQFRVYREAVQVEQGITKYFEYLWRRDGTRVIATNSEREVLLTREYRFELGGYDWRLPGGKLDHEQEPPEQAAAREFEEETGYKATSLKHLSTTTPFATIRYRIHFFLAENPILGRSNPESGETISFRWIKLKDVAEMALRGDIQEDISALAIIRLASRAGSF